MLEILVTTVEDQISETMQTAGKPFVPLLGTLFIFLAFANVLGVVPGLRPPTASLETAAALALIVFLAVHVYGLRRRGLRVYLGSYAKPTIVMLPLNVLSEITRTFSLMVRLFGNVLSGEFVIATVAGVGRPVRADPVDGARDSDRPDPGLHLHGARGGVHRRRHRQHRAGVNP